MDIQKEREAFEEWYENHKPVLLVENIVKGTARAAWQAAKDESHKQAALYQSEINHLAQANQQWREKAAKAQAIPDGFVVVPKEPNKQFKNVLSLYLDELCRGGYGCDLDGFVSINGVDSDQVWKMVIDTKAMIDEVS